MRRAARRDANHGTIKDVFLSLDCSVIDCAGAPIGFDLIVAYKAACIMVEVKDGEKVASARKLTENEERIHLYWKGPKAIVKNNQEAVAVVKLLRSRHFAIVDGRCEELLAG